MKIENQCNAKREKRNVGIDLLRLVAMYCVVVLHILGHGGVLESDNNNAIIISSFLEVFTTCAVNCYAIISGYVSYSEAEREYRYGKYFALWFQVLSYSFGLAFCCLLLRPNMVSAKTLLESTLPVTFNQYWYFSAYTGVFFLAPWFNRFVRRCSEKEVNRFVFLIFVVFCGYGMLANNLYDPFTLNGGYSFLWLSLLYLVGAWMKKCDVPKKIKSSNVALVIVCLWLLTFVCKVILPQEWGVILTSYTSVINVMMAMGYVICFSKLHLQGVSKRMIDIFAPAAFGVYLFHEHWLVREGVISNILVGSWTGSVYMLVLKVLGTALLVFVIGLMVEKIRAFVFKMIKIEFLIEKMGNKFDVFVRKADKKEEKVL